MTNDIVEADQPMGTAAAVIEKAARQLVYDSRYKVSQQLGKKKKDIDPRTFDAMVLQQISKSKGPAVARAKQMLLKKRGPVKEDFIPMMEDAAANSVANAMFKVFVEGVKVEQEIELNYLKELDEKKERKYKVRVTDKKTRNSYVRYATREKISELRANPNILSVEITEYGEPREGERKQGESTARALGGGGKKAKRDYDRDGKVESSSKEHAGAVHNAIQRKMGGKPDGQDTRKTVSASFEPDGESLNEMGPPRFRNRNKDNVKSSRSHPGRGGGSIRNHQARFNASNPSTTSSDSSNGNDVKEAHKPGHKKGKVEKWWDNDGDNIGWEKHEVKKEEFIADAAAISADPDANTKKITGLKAGETNKVVVFPNDSTTDRQGTGSATPRSVYAHTELKGDVIAETGYQKFLNMIQEKAESEQQQKLFGLALSVKRGETPRSEVSAEVLKIVDTMSEKKIRDFAKTKHKGLPKKKVQKEEKECGCDDEPKMKERENDTEDMRGVKTKVNLVKNKLRSMGLNMSYEPEGEKIDEVAGLLLKGALAAGGVGLAANALGRGMKKFVDTHTKTKPSDYKNQSGLGANLARQREKLNQLNSYEPEGEMVDEGRDRYRSLGRADQNNSRRNRGLGGGTPDDIADDNRRANEAAARTLEQLRRRRAAEAARKEGR